MTDGLSFSPAELERMGYKVQGGVCVPIGERGVGSVSDERAVQLATPRSQGSSHTAIWKANSPGPLGVHVHRYGVAPNGRPYKSKWEAEYGFWLATLLGVDAIAWWSYECFKLRLADGAYFTPDFPVLTSHGDLVMREVKGHWREAARLRVKVAASQFPWLRIEIISKQKGQWVNVETFNA